MKIINFPKTAHDIPTFLREIADQIEAGEYGDAEHCILVLDGEHVFGTGDNNTISHGYMMLHAGARQLMERVND